MSPRTPLADPGKVSPNVTLARNCLVVCFRKLENTKDIIPYGDQSVVRRLGTGGWSSDSESPFSSEPPDSAPSLLSSPVSWPDSPPEQGSLRCTCRQVDGWTLFTSFIRENSACFWNPSLAGSVASLEFKGYLLPTSILMSGTEYALEMIRTSWTRRVLKAPQGYAIDSLGDVALVEMASINQACFAPLGEAVCKCVHYLNQSGINATLEVIGRNLNCEYPNMIPPSVEVLRNSLKSLVKDGHLRYMSNRGYFVVSPEARGKRMQGSSTSPLGAQVPMLMTNEEAIFKLHGGSSASATIGGTLNRSRSLGIQVDVPSLGPSTCIDWQPSDGSDSLSDNQKGSSLKRSASLRIQSEKVKESLEDRSFSFMRSKSFRMSREKQHKLPHQPPHQEHRHLHQPSSPSPSSYSSRTETPKKPSMLSKFLVRWSHSNSHSKGKGKEAPTQRINFSSQFPDTSEQITQMVRVSKEAQTQTLTRSGKNTNVKTVARRAQSRSAVHKQAKTMTRPIAVSIPVHFPYHGQLYEKREICCGVCSHGAVNQQNLEQYNGYSDVCITNGGYYCEAPIDPNCEHCYAAVMCSCASYLPEYHVPQHNHLNGKHNHMNGKQSAQPIVSQSVPVSRSRTPLKLNSNKQALSQVNSGQEQVHPIGNRLAVESNGLNGENRAASSGGRFVRRDVQESHPFEETLLSNLKSPPTCVSNKGPSLGLLNPLPLSRGIDKSLLSGRQSADNGVKGEKLRFQRKGNESKATGNQLNGTPEQLDETNSVNVKIEIDSTTTTSLSSNCPPSAPAPAPAPQGAAFAQKKRGPGASPSSENVSRYEPSSALVGQRPANKSVALSGNTRVCCSASSSSSSSTTTSSFSSSTDTGKDGARSPSTLTTATKVTASMSLPSGLSAENGNRVISITSRTETTQTEAEKQEAEEEASEEEEPSSVTPCLVNDKSLIPLLEKGPQTDGSSISINEYANKKLIKKGFSKGGLRPAPGMTSFPPTVGGEPVSPSLSSVRERVAKAKAAFFTGNPNFSAMRGTRPSATATTE